MGWTIKGRNLHIEWSDRRGKHICETYLTNPTYQLNHLLRLQAFNNLFLINQTNLVIQMDFNLATIFFLLFTQVDRYLKFSFITNWCLSCILPVCMSRAPFTQFNEQSLMRLRKSANVVRPDSKGSSPFHNSI